MDLTKKDVIRINQDIGASGIFHNESSLDYALGVFKQRKGWLFELAQITRSLIIDYAFQDGNKRTALAIILLYFDDKNIKPDEQRLLLTIEKISKKNINNVNKIMRSIQNGIS